MQAQTAQSHQIELMGQKFKISSDDSPDHLQAVAEYVNGKLTEMTGGQTVLPSQQLLLMATLNLADELFKVRAAHEALTAKIRDTSRSLLTRLGA